MSVCLFRERSAGQRRRTPTLEEALQVVLGHSRPSFASTAPTSSSTAPAPTSNTVPTQFTWSPMFMSPGSSQNPLRLSRQGTGSTPDQAAPGEGLFANSRGLFRQVLTDHHQSSQNLDQNTSRNGITTAGTGTRAVNGAGNGPVMTSAGGMGVAPSAPKNYMSQESVGGVCSGAAGPVPGVRGSSAGVMENCASRSRVGVSGVTQNGFVGGVGLTDSILSSDSLIHPHQPDFDGRPGNRRPESTSIHGVQDTSESRERGLTTKRLESTSVVGSPAISGSAQSHLQASGLERSGRTQIRADANGNVSTPSVGAVHLDSRLSAGLRPRFDRIGTDPVREQSRNGATGVPADLFGVESGTDQKDRSAGLTQSVAGATNTCEDVRSVEKVATTSDVVVDPTGSPSSTGQASSSFFLHRNAPSPNVAIVQPSVHPTISQASSTPGIHPVITPQASGTPGIHPRISQASSTLGIRPVISQASGTPASSGLPDSFPRDWNTARSRPVGTGDIHRQQVVNFVSVPSTPAPAPSPLNTTTVLLPEKGLTKPPETYRKSTAGEEASALGTIFAIPPSYAPAADCRPTEPSTSMSGRAKDSCPAMDFRSATCIKDNFTYEEIPVDDTSSVSSVTSDIACTTRCCASGQSAALGQSDH